MLQIYISHNVASSHRPKTGIIDAVCVYSVNHYDIVRVSKMESLAGRRLNEVIANPVSGSLPAVKVCQISRAGFVFLVVHMRRIDLVGKRFERLVVLKYVGNRKWLCQCDCGNVKTIYGDDIRTSHTKSCGCWNLEVRSRPQAGITLRRLHPEYSVWHGMRSRCNNPRNISYEWYGGRGVVVCSRWDDFDTFLSDVGARPSPEHSIDRIDPNGNYEPGNVRWATASEQTNNRRNTVLLHYQGRVVTVPELAAERGLKYSTVNSRLRKGWTVEDSIGPTHCGDCGRKFNFRGGGYCSTCAK